MAPTRRGTARAAPAELSMQQVLEIMRGLQQDMAKSKLEQERMQADLEASHERNEEPVSYTHLTLPTNREV